MVEPWKKVNFVYTLSVVRGSAYLAQVLDISVLETASVPLASWL